MPSVAGWKQVSSVVTCISIIEIFKWQQFECGKKTLKSGILEFVPQAQKKKEKSAFKTVKVKCRDANFVIFIA